MGQPEGPTAPLEGFREHYVRAVGSLYTKTGLDRLETTKIAAFSLLDASFLEGACLHHE